MHDFELEKIAVDLAYQAYKEYNGDKERCFEILDEIVQGSDHVIYFAKAHAVCQNCHVTAGEDYAYDMGPPSDGWTYNTLATVIAYGELIYRAQMHLDDFFNDPSKAEEAKLLESFQSN